MELNPKSVEYPGERVEERIWEPWMGHWSGANAMLFGVCDDCVVDMDVDEVEELLTARGFPFPELGSGKGY